MRMERFVAVAVVGGLGLALAGCDRTRETGSGSRASGAPETFPAGTTMARLHKEQRITIGTKFDQPGFGLKGLSGKPEGFDIEIGKIIARGLGVPVDKIEWVETPSKVREDYIEQGRVDIVVATYTINDKRKDRIDFAGPYYEAGQNLMVRSDDSSITGPDSLKDGARKVCSATGSTSGETIKKYVVDPASQLVLFDTYDKCRDALKGKQVDAVSTDNVILLGYIARGAGAFRMAAGANFTAEPYGIGLKKGDKAFRAYINDTLDRIDKDGEWKRAWDATAGKFGASAGTPPAVNRY
jgi:glutamate transport system substrate-binding protein